MTNLKQRSILDVAAICVAIAMVIFSLALVTNLVGGPYIAYSVSYVVAEKLPEKPDAYFVLENPESYLLQTMTSLDWVKVNSSQFTQINEMKTAHNTSHVEFNGNYYTIQLVLADGLRPNEQWNIAVAILIFLAVSLLAISFFKVGKHFVKAHNKIQNIPTS